MCVFCLCNFIYCFNVVMYYAMLYAGEFLQLTTGQMGVFCSCNFNITRNFGAVEFTLLYLHSLCTIYCCFSVWLLHFRTGQLN